MQSANLHKYVQAVSFITHQNEYINRYRNNYQFQTANEVIHDAMVAHAHEAEGYRDKLHSPVGSVRNDTGEALSQAQVAAAKHRQVVGC